VTLQGEKLGKSSLNRVQVPKSLWSRYATRTHGAASGVPASLPVSGAGVPGARQSLTAPVARILEQVYAHDPYTHGHSLRVGSYATVVARLLGFDAGAIDTIRRAAMVHDIGKCAIPIELLGKTEPLDDSEFDLIKQHPILGCSYLENDELKPLRPMVLHHHERWDGRGYPTGLMGVDIPIESRIILVVDAFDAMTTNRPYGKVRSKADAIAEVAHCSGKQFDPLIAGVMQFAYNYGLLEDSAIEALEGGAELHELLPHDLL
jgi:HD-GYP domain-containing protein (c-di-GMP phosphodiesterase class II)